ncbi:MAG: RNA polymerase sigma factor [Planctomycetota bacterium]
MSLSEDSFREDLVSARAGSREALDRLLSGLEMRFRADAERRVGVALRGRTRVSDILQDAYVEVVRSLGKFEGDSEAAFCSWVTSIIESTAKRQHRHLTAQKRKPPSGTTEWNAMAGILRRVASSPLSDLQKTEDAGLILDAIGSLREDYQVAIEQMVLLGRPVEEVAEQLGRTVAATRMMLSRARASLTLRIDELDRARHGDS